ncbi:MAG: hypothetical protein DDT33_01295 [Firmicutes bacterium]|nr:hypothetical protein [Bacillota bacterium]
MPSEKGAAELAILDKREAHKAALGGSWLDKYTLELLETMWLKIDSANFMRYYLLRKGQTSAKLKLKGKEHYVTRKLIRQGAGLNLWGDPPRRRRYMAWPTLGKCAEALEVPMELLVDEDRYFNWGGLFGIAGYRILCEAYRQGMSMKELTQHDSMTARGAKALKWWYYTWHLIMSGRINRSWGNTVYNMFDVLKCCQDRLGVLTSHLIGRPLHITNTSAAYEEFTNVLAALNQREIVVVAGMAKALHDYKHGGLPLQDNVNRLLKWYETPQITTKEP